MSVYVCCIFLNSGVLSTYGVILSNTRYVMIWNPYMYPGMLYCQSERYYASVKMNAPFYGINWIKPADQQGNPISQK